MSLKYENIERRFQRDEGGRGISALIPEKSQIFEACERLKQCKSVGILTGFPCIVNKSVRIESDGLAGALSVGRVLNSAGIEVCILIEEEDLYAVRELVEWNNKEFQSNINVDSSLELEFEGILAIERTGRAVDGKFYTMRARALEGVQEFDTVYLDQRPCKVKVAIGDGGNEAGLGPIQEKVKAYIPNGEIIASTSYSDIILMSSVSTWGGYGLALALSLSFGLTPQLSASDELKVSEKMIQLGICDGITHEPNLGVDGLDWCSTETLINDLLEIYRLGI